MIQPDDMPASTNKAILTLFATYVFEIYVDEALLQ